MTLLFYKLSKLEIRLLTALVHRLIFLGMQTVLCQDVLIHAV